NTKLKIIIMIMNIANQNVIISSYFWLKPKTNKNINAISRIMSLIIGLTLPTLPPCLVGYLPKRTHHPQILMALSDSLSPAPILGHEHFLHQKYSLFQTVLLVLSIVFQCVGILDNYLYHKQLLPYP